MKRTRLSSRRFFFSYENLKKKGWSCKVFRCVVIIRCTSFFFFNIIIIRVAYCFPCLLDDKRAEITIKIFGKKRKKVKNDCPPGKQLLSYKVFTVCACVCGGGEKKSKIWLFVLSLFSSICVGKELVRF